ncbi:MAG: YggT family protein [Firmicutes bacterium]|nr:YggT family protein [Bacillota bacterium]
MPSNFRTIINWIFEVYYWLLIIRILFPLVRLGRTPSPVILTIRRIVYAVTEPVLAPIRNLLNPISLGTGLQLDVSPIVAMILLRFVNSMIGRLF